MTLIPDIKAEFSLFSGFLFILLLSGTATLTLDIGYLLSIKHAILPSKKISNDQELIQSDPISCPQNQKGNN